MWRMMSSSCGCINGSPPEMVMTDVQRNPSLSADEFKVQLGSDIKIVRG